MDARIGLAVNGWFEPFGNVLVEHRRRKTPKGFSIHHFRVEGRLHFRGMRIVAERTRTGLQASLEPAERLPVSEIAGASLDRCTVIEPDDARRCNCEPYGTFVIARGGTETGILHAVAESAQKIV